MKKVAKFGGTSLASAAQFKKVADIVHADPARVFVVPSAPGKRYAGDEKVTDMLYGCYAKAESGEAFAEELARIQARYSEIAHDLGIETIDIDAEFATISKAFEAVAGVAYAASRGEYLNGLLLSAYLEFDFIDPKDCVLFNADGSFDDEQTNTALGKRLACVKNAVIPGFYGSKPDGSIQTFSRGGSDITGSIVAKAGEVDIYENWTDVSGFMVADPRIIENPEIIRVITYRELRELSYMGAAVLHEDSVFPVRKSGIPINIRNTNEPDNEGTMIVETTCQISPYRITGIAGKQGFVSINIEKDRMNSEIGFGRKVLEAFERRGISFEHMPSGIDTMTVFVHQAEFAGKEQLVLSDIRRMSNPDSIEIESDLALIAVVGRGMKSMRGTAGRIFSALAHANVNIKMIDQGSSELNIIVGVRNDDFNAAVKAIYDIFVLSAL